MNNHFSNTEKDNLPHHGVYTRLGPSSVHGVGVFAVRLIPKGVYVFQGEDEDIVWIAPELLTGLPESLLKLYTDFAIVRNGYYGCPRNFNLLCIPWYVNHSKCPNLECDESFRFHANRDIQPGEELLLDYETYNDAGTF